VKPDLRSLTLAQLQALCAELGWPRYTAAQVFTWLWQKGVDDLAAMTNLSKERRALLSERFSLLPPLSSLLSTASDDDGTTKFTFKLADGNIIESVLIGEGSGVLGFEGPGSMTRTPALSDRGLRGQPPDAGTPARRTVCVSTQVGCKLGCTFCFTGTHGFRRDLSWHEIAAQVLAVRSFVIRHSDFVITNVVFMGMGEPFLNYDATIEAAKTINAENGLGIGARRITISTSGIPDGIRAFARVEEQFRLALSLNASDDETRSRLMPVNKIHPLKDVMAAMRDYTDAKGKRVTFEYVLVDGINNRDRDVKQLAALLKGIPCKLNLIPLNPFAGCELTPPAPESVETFARKLWPHVPAVTVRRSKGASILAGCGQLAGLAG